MRKRATLMRKPRLIILSAITSLVGVGVLSAALLLPASSGARKPTGGHRTHLGPGAEKVRALLSPFSPPARIHVASRAIVLHYSVLRVARQANAEPLPAVFGHLSSRQRAMGLDMNSARAITLPGRVTIWLIPGSAGTCMAVQSGPNSNTPVGSDDNTAVCGANSVGSSQVANTGLYYVEPLGGTERMVGIVPDGNSAVSVTKGDGSSITVPVIDNGFVATTPIARQFNGFSVRSPSGSTTHNGLPDISIVHQARG